MLPVLLINYTTERRQSRWMDVLKVFFPKKKNIEEQDKHFYACMHHGPT